MLSSPVQSQSQDGKCRHHELKTEFHEVFDSEPSEDTNLQPGPESSVIIRKWAIDPSERARIMNAASSASMPSTSVFIADLTSAGDEKGSSKARLSGKRTLQDVYVEVPALQSILKRRRHERLGENPAIAAPETKALARVPSKVRSINQVSFIVSSLVLFQAKGKRQALTHVDSVMGRIGSAKAYNIELTQKLQEATFSRAFISSIYGGSTMSTFPTISPAFLAIHGLDDFMYPTLEYNPYAPSRPGAPGLFFRVIPGPADAWDKVQRVIISPKSGVWIYVGQYKLEPAPSLTVEEWLSQPNKLRKTWVNQVLKKEERGLPARASISLRKELNRNPTTEEVDAACKSGNKFKALSLEEIQEALDSGLERVAVWRMECIAYDSGFQKNLVAKFPSYVPKPKTTRKGASTKTKK
ncbi:hypothetical protein HGRIS_009010 [Hohenbuehelia grisea]|uniref:DUF6697 domain-containing protein n=1 Tax=Hohenbuehelia grisea TaxID=104357 RepID=A0ABR3J066_9AGAR